MNVNVEILCLESGCVAVFDILATLEPMVAPRMWCITVVVEVRRALDCL